MITSSVVGIRFARPTIRTFMNVYATYMGHDVPVILNSLIGSYKQVNENDDEGLETLRLSNRVESCASVSNRIFMKKSRKCASELTCIWFFFALSDGIIEREKKRGATLSRRPPLLVITKCMHKEYNMIA